MGLIISQMTPLFRSYEESSPLLDTNTKNPYAVDPCTPRKKGVSEHEALWLASETPQKPFSGDQSTTPISKVTATATPNKLEISQGKDDEVPKDIVDPDLLVPDEALFYYACRGDVEGIQNSYRRGARVNVDCDGDNDDPTEGNQTLSHNYPLHVVSENGFLEALNELIELKADLEVCNRVGSTPLHRACSNNQFEIAQRLLKEGANPFAVNKIGNTPLHCAAYGGYTEIARLLLEFSAAPCLDGANLVGMTPLQAATIASNSATIQLFRKYKKRKQKPKETSISFVDVPVVIDDDAAGMSSDGDLKPHFDIVVEDGKQKLTSPLTTPKKVKIDRSSTTPTDWKKLSLPRSKSRRLSETSDSTPSTPSKSFSSTYSNGSPSRNSLRPSPRKKVSKSPRGKAERTRQRVTQIAAILAA